MSETRPRPQPGEQWRTYHMTPFGPGAINSLAEIIETVQDPHRQSIVRYRYIYPVKAEQVDEMLLHVFVDSRVAPYESEEDWMRRKGSDPASGLRASWGDAIGRAVAALKADDTDYSFRCECGFSTRDSRYEARICPHRAGPVRPDEEPTT